MLAKSVSPPPSGGMMRWCRMLAIGGIAAHDWSVCHTSPETRLELASKCWRRASGYFSSGFDAVPSPPTWMCSSPKYWAKRRCISRSIGCSRKKTTPCFASASLMPFTCSGVSGFVRSTLPTSAPTCGERGVTVRVAKRSILKAEDALRVAVEDLLHHFVLVAELLPLAQDPLVRHARIVAAEHDLVLQPAAHVDLEVPREVFRRPARHLPVDVALVQRDGGGLVDPGPAGMRHDDLQLGEIGGQPVDRRRMRMPDDRAVPAGHAGAHAGGADVDHHRRAERGNLLEHRARARIVHREVLHDRMEV